MGTLVVNAPLAATLQRLGAEGRSAIYQGSIAAELVRVANAAGSPLAMDDLAAYRPVPRDSCEASGRGSRWRPCPPRRRVA